MKLKVSIAGHGTYQIDSINVNKLIEWLNKHDAIAIREQNTIREIDDNRFTGRELINESSRSSS